MSCIDEKDNYIYIFCSMFLKLHCVLIQLRFQFCYTVMIFHYCILMEWKKIQINKVIYYYRPPVWVESKETREETSKYFK